MPGLVCTKVDYFHGKDLTNNLFGYFFCDVEVGESKYLGVLPFRDKSGIYFPVGKWSGSYFSEELKFAQECGYNIKVYKGYIFSRQFNEFNDYIEAIYKKNLTP